MMVTNMAFEVRQLRILTQYSHFCDNEPLTKSLGASACSSKLRGRKSPPCRDAVRTEHYMCVQPLVQHLVLSY